MDPTPPSPRLAPNARPPSLRGARRLQLVVLTIATIVVLAGAGYGAWYLFLRPTGPAPVDLGGLSIPSPAPGSGAAASVATSASSAPTVAGGTPFPAASSAASGATSLDGTWAIDPQLGSGSSGTFVGYRVQERLASIGANTAVGRTSNVTGSFTVEGATITAATFTADLTALQSDDARRDGQLQRQGLETATYPTATFVLSQPIQLGAVPTDGVIVKAQATGRLTLHGQTRTVEVPLEAKISGDVIAVTASLPIAFADYGIQPPSSFMVLSVADHGTMELQLLFKRG